MTQCSHYVSSLLCHRKHGMAFADPLGSLGKSCPPLLHRRGGHQKPQCGMRPQYRLRQDLYRHWRDDDAEASRVRLRLRHAAARRSAPSARPIHGQPRPPQRLFRLGCAWPLLYGQQRPLLLLVFAKGSLQFGLPTSTHEPADLVALLHHRRPGDGHFHAQAASTDLKMCASGAQAQDLA